MLDRVKEVKILEQIRSEPYKWTGVDMQTYGFVLGTNNGSTLKEYS